MNKNREARHSVAEVIASYAAFVVMEPGLDESRRELIEDVVRSCDQQHRWRMYAVIRGMGLRHQDAEDVLQEILLRWTRQLEAGRNLPAPESLTAWFRKVARYAAIAYLRRLRGKRRNAEKESARRRFSAEQRTPLAALALRELPEVISRVLEDRCTPKMREIFERRRQGGTYAEIANQLNERSAEAVRSVMRQVLGILYEELARLGWES